jgi:hypothetical protein
MTTLCCLALVWQAGCSTHADRLYQIRLNYFGNNLPAAETAIDAGLKRGGKEADVFRLERSMVLLASGRTKEAEQTLRQVRDNFDHLEQASAAETALSLVTDSTSKAYAGEDYEKVLVRSLLAITNLLEDGGDALAYCHQITDKQQQIIQTAAEADGTNPKLGYKQVALGPYLHGLIRESSHAAYDDAARANTMVVSWQPDFPYGRQDLERVQRGRHSAPGHGVLYVFTLVGRGPYKEETVEVASSVSLLIADRILSCTGKHTLPPTIAPIKVPKVVTPGNEVSHVRVTVDHRLAGDTATITDVGRMAVEQYEAIYPRVIADAVVRRVVKKGIIYGAKELTGVDRRSPASLALDLAGVAWEATEAADTRCWGLLPDKIQVLRIELPAGGHEIGLQTIGCYGSQGRVETKAIEILDGQNTYLLASFPQMQLVGQIAVGPKTAPQLTAARPTK